jgi:hypothetical protein
VNNESLHSNPNEQSLDQCFANRPRLRQRLLCIADMIDQAVAEGCTAHEAETRAIAQIRKLGNEVLTDWAEKAEPSARRKAQEQKPDLIHYGKKALKWHSTYGDICLSEQCLRRGRVTRWCVPFASALKQSTWLFLALAKGAGGLWRG